MTSRMTWSAPDASMNAEVAAVGPNMNGFVPCNDFSSSHTSVVVGSSAA